MRGCSCEVRSRDVNDLIDFHDLTIDSLLVDSKGRRLVLRASDAHAPDAPASTVEFSGVGGYCLVGDVLGTIICDLEEREPLELYREFATRLQADYSKSGAHDPWVVTEPDAVTYFRENSIRAFAMYPSIGAIGAIWCREVHMWVDSNGSA